MTFATTSYIAFAVEEESELLAMALFVSGIEDASWVASDSPA